MASVHTEHRAAETEYRMAAVARSSGRGAWPWYALAVLLFGVDRLLKVAALAKGTVADPGAVEFSLFRNTGIAFSLPLPSAVYWPAAVVFFALLVAFFVRSLRHDPRRAAAAFVVIVGAVSNLFDRAVYGATIDYLLFFGRSAVNVADGMILAGLAVLVLFDGKRPATSAGA